MGRDRMLIWVGGDAGELLSPCGLQLAFVNGLGGGRRKKVGVRERGGGVSKRRGGRISYQQRASEAEVQRRKGKCNERGRQAGCATGQPY
jgi:hypothetical protein